MSDPSVVNPTPVAGAAAAPVAGAAATQPASSAPTTPAAGGGAVAFSTVAELKSFAPKLYQAIEQSIFMQVKHMQDDSTQRIKAMLNDPDSQ